MGVGRWRVKPHCSCTEARPAYGTKKCTTTVMDPVPVPDKHSEAKMEARFCRRSGGADGWALVLECAAMYGIRQQFGVTRDGALGDVLMFGKKRRGRWKGS